MRYLIIVLLCVLSGCKSDTSVLEKIEKISKSGDCYQCIKTLSEKTPARMSGSMNNANAIAFLKSEMEQTGAEVNTDSVNVPLWLPGSASLFYMDESGRKDLNVIPLGLSVGTGGKELNLKVVEFKNKSDFEKASSLEGCIVFFNEKMDTTENGYSKAGWQRMFGDECHLYNLEIDSVAEEPLGFALFEREDIYNKIKTMSDSLQFTPELQRMPLEEASFWPLNSEKNVPVYFYMAERNNYFSIHHSAVDNMSLIDKEVINRSSAMIASFVYLTDRYMCGE